MKYHKVPVAMNSIGQLKGMLNMAQQFAPEAVEDATIMVVWDEDLTDEELDQGLGAVFYVDDKTYQMARQYGSPPSTGMVDIIPGAAEDYFE